MAYIRAFISKGVVFSLKCPEESPGKLSVNPQTFKTNPRSLESETVGKVSDLCIWEKAFQVVELKSILLGK